MAFDPLNENSKGNFPNSSWVYARWSSFLEKLGPFRGSKRKSPVMSSNIIQAKLHMSAVLLYFEPIRTLKIYYLFIITSGDRYYLVCINVENWWWTQQALPRSAIFILKLSASSLCWLNLILFLYVYQYSILLSVISFKQILLYIFFTIYIGLWLLFRLCTWLLFIR